MVTHFLGNTELGQILTLPKLISHYLQHHSIDPDVGFIDFMFMHYIIDDDGSMADNQEDAQLPFHNFNYQHSFVQMFSLAERFSYTNLYMPLQPKVFGADPQERLHTGYTSLRLQPPWV